MANDITERDVKKIVDAIIKNNHIDKPDVQVFESSNRVTYYTNQETILTHKKF